jgi:transposase
MDTAKQYPTAAGGRSISAFAEAYDVSVPTVNRMIRRGQLTAHKIGSRTIITHADEAAFLASLPRASSTTMEATCQLATELEGEMNDPS